MSDLVAQSDGEGPDPRPISASDAATLEGVGAAVPGSDGELSRVRGGVMHRLFGDPLPKRLLGRYTLIERIGRGGMGDVYLAEDPELARKVAIKLLPGYQRQGPESTRRLLHEARAVARLSHPNVVEVFDVGVHAGVPFVVMELVEGGTFTDWLAVRERSHAEIVAALLDAAEGLAAAHRVGLLHRDFKPANVLVGPGTRMRVADFGLALARAPGELATTDDGIDTEASTLELGGTPAFMPPEQHAAKPLDASVDVYAFCATLHLACYGELPFRGSLPAIVAAKLDYDGAPPVGRRIDARLHAVIARGLQPDPARRWRSMEALTGALRRAMRRSPTRALAWLAVPVLALSAWP
ncbi:MAG: serine/threonine protein kinase, partial [Deltaproteobacteria bacterium]|nr:serine/threonine protein kinase [Nannocystaceae bacterium]